MERDNNFITLYTDASYSHELKYATLAWRGKCHLGKIEGTDFIDSTDSNHAEMMAILAAIKDAISTYPTLGGFFINSDNLTCVRSFWTFLDKHKIPACVKEPHAEILELVGTRWIRAKHVKAHTGGGDMRSYMNRYVDRLTRVEP